MLDGPRSHVPRARFLANLVFAVATLAAMTFPYCYVAALLTSRPSIGQLLA
jgi:hypothetical protein